MGSIDRWPAHLLTKKMTRMAYEYPTTPLMVSGLCDLYEYNGVEGFEQKHPLATEGITEEKRCEVRKARADYVRPTPENAKYPAHFWTIESLKTSKFAEGMFRLGDDDDDRPLRAKLKVFIQYLESNRDDAPLYLFEDDLKRSALTAPITKYVTLPSLNSVLCTRAFFHPVTFFVTFLRADSTASRPTSTSTS
jgi:hypothetical protein